MKLNTYIDHTLLKPAITESELKKVCNEAIKYKFKSVCVASSNIKKVTNFLKNSEVLPIAVIGFPLGSQSTKVKIQEAEFCRKNGAKEIDMVINLSWVKDKKFNQILKEINKIKSKSKLTLKVIIETGLLSKKEIIKLSKIVGKSKADYIKTCTGFNGGQATVEDIALMKKYSNGKKVKASGGIKERKQAEELIKAGADRLGTSNGVLIIKDKTSKNSY